MCKFKHLSNNSILESASINTLEKYDIVPVNLSETTATWQIAVECVQRLHGAAPLLHIDVTSSRRYNGEKLLLYRLPFFMHAVPKKGNLMNTPQSQQASEEQLRKKLASEKRKKWFQRGIIIILIIIIILLLLRSCGGPVAPIDEPDNTPIGDYIVSDDQQQQKQESVEEGETPTITFSGYGSYAVSEATPNIELSNPANNFVDMVFTLTDVSSGEIITRTDKVSPGKYVYVNIVDFYTQPGVYDIDIVISTFDPDTNAEMNGMHQEMEVTVS